MPWGSEKRGFTFIWKIENFSCCFQKQGEELVSPEFVAKTFSGSSKWYLELLPRGEEDENEIDLHLHRSYWDSGPGTIRIDYELAVLTTDCSPPETCHVKNRLFCNEQNDGIMKFISRKDILNSRFLLNDTLTVRCRMSNRSLQRSEPQLCFGRTRIGTQLLSFVSAVEDFSGIGPNHTRTTLIKLASVEKFKLSMTLFMTRESEIRIRINLTDTDLPKYARSSISLVETTGNIPVSTEDEHWFEAESPEQVWNHSICINKEEIMSKKSLYLPNDTLYLQCEIRTAYEIQMNEIDGVGSRLSCIRDLNMKYSHSKIQAGILNQMSCLSTANDAPDCKQSHSTGELQRSSAEEQFPASKVPPVSLMDDLRCAFKEKILCDVKLRTESETFPAHRLVLSARSTVFKAMFSSNMKEKTSDCIDIPDLDTDTVRQMLSFLYTDTVEALDIDGASKLYFAADKYNINSLKGKCSSLLKAQLSESTACAVLVLADLHQDSDLKAAVQDFVLRKDKEILRSKEWKNFEQNNMELAIETLPLVDLKKLEN